MIVNFPNVSLEPVGLRKYFPTVTAFICRALCFCIHLKVCSRWWGLTPSVCSGLTSLNVSVGLSILIVSTILTVNPANEKS